MPRGAYAMSGGFDCALEDELWPWWSTSKTESGTGIDALVWAWLNLLLTQSQAEFCFFL